MELEEAITILEATIGEFKYLQSTLDEDERELYEHGIQIQEIKALEIVLEALKNSIPKKKIEDELNKRKKAIKPYEEYNKESRQYWIDTGVISYCEELLEDK